MKIIFVVSFGLLISLLAACTESADQAGKETSNTIQNSLNDGILERERTAAIAASEKMPSHSRRAETEKMTIVKQDRVAEIRSIDTESEITGKYTGELAKRFPYKISARQKIENRDSKSSITITALYGSKPSIGEHGEYLIYGKLRWTRGSKEYLYFGAQGHDSGISGLERWFYPKRSVSNFMLGIKPGPNSPLFIGTFEKPKDNWKYTIWLTN
ncbi:MAG: hypothetical protein QM496_22570 [Verrucomicrobiota bacterium]